MQTSTVPASVEPILIAAFELRDAVRVALAQTTVEDDPLPEPIVNAMRALERSTPLRRYTARHNGEDAPPWDLLADSDEAALELVAAEAESWGASEDADGRSTEGRYSLRLSTIDQNGNECELDDVDVVVPVPEPKCAEGCRHRWTAPHARLGGVEENPGVFGHGAGIRILRVCDRCGCLRTVDTAATERSTGRTVEATTYEEGWLARR